MSFLQSSIILLAFLQLAVQLLLKNKNEKKIKSLQECPPEDVQIIMDHETWKKTSNYSLDKSRLSNWEEILGFLIFIPTFLFFFPWYFASWDTSAETSLWSCAVSVCTFFLILQFPSLPLEWYRQFVLEEKYGFNKSTLKLWLSDKLKGVVLSFVIGVPLLGLLIFLFREISIVLPNTWWILSFCIFFLIQLILMVLWPKIFLPLFNKLTPLDDGSLKDRLQALADRSGFKAKTIEVIDGSKRSGHSNAFFTGFGKFRRIVLYDTLLEQMEETEIEAVLAHEVGHYRKGHIPQRLVISFASELGIFALIAYALQSEWIYHSLNLTEDLVGSLSSILVFLSISLGYFTYWLSPFSNLLSRKHEFEADSFAKDSIGSEEPLIQALRKLYKENLTHPLPHAWIAAFHFSHPTIIERERALRA